MGIDCLACLAQARIICTTPRLRGLIVVRRQTKTTGNPMKSKQTYWFHAKDPEVGVGWSGPASWQGWVSLALFIAAVIVSAALMLPQRFGSYLLLLAVLSAAFIALCIVKGAPRSER